MSTGITNSCFISTEERLQRVSYRKADCNIVCSRNLRDERTVSMPFKGCEAVKGRVVAVSEQENMTAGLQVSAGSEVVLNMSSCIDTCRMCPDILQCVADACGIIFQMFIPSQDFRHVSNEMPRTRHWQP